MNCSFPDNEIDDVNNLLHRLLGAGFIEILNRKFIGEDVIILNKERTLYLIKKLSKERYLELYKFLNFYHPRWIAYNIIRESNDEYAEYSSNNELILALTSIIDSISLCHRKKSWFKIFFNIKNEGYTNKFINFLETHLSESEVVSIFENSKIYKKNKLKNITSLKDFARYIYKVRSLVVHEAELGGIYPYNITFKIDPQNKFFTDIVAMIAPGTARKLLWTAIFNYLGIDIIIKNSH